MMSEEMDTVDKLIDWCIKYKNFWTTHDNSSITISNLLSFYPDIPFPIFVRFWRYNNQHKIKPNRENAEKIISEYMKEKLI